ncbi:MAG: phenylacetate--CoA ligase family protein, partial [bacterium]
PESWARLFAEKQHQVIVASASTLQALAEAIAMLGLETSQPRIIVSDSETLSPITRRLIRRILGTDPVDVYGLVELSNFAWQCEYRRSYHVSADSHIVEVAAPPGETGPIIATDLGMWTMPIIRYNTGDLAEFDPRPCPCGRRLPALSRIYGRAVDSVVLANSGRLFWPFFHEVLADYEQLRQWQVTQTALQCLSVQLALPLEDIELLGKIKSDLRNALPKEIELQIVRVDSIPVTPGEKARMVISKINTSTKKASEVEQ